MIRPVTILMAVAAGLLLSLGHAAVPPSWSAAAAPYRAELGGDPTFRIASGNPMQRSADGGASWTPSSIPGHRVHGVVAVESTPASFYALTSPADAVAPTTFHFTRDGGASWEATAADLRTASGRNFSSVTAIGPQPGLVYALVSGQIASDGSRANVAALRSRDGGRTWISIAEVVNGWPLSLVVSPSHPDALYMPTTTSTYRSFDGGDTWTFVSANGLDSHRPAAIDAGDPRVVYSSSQETVWVSEDAGTSWRAAPRLDFRHASPTAEIAVRADPVEAGVVYAIDTDGIVFRSRDRGRSWRQVSLPGGFEYGNVMDGLRLARTSSRVVMTATGRELRIDGEPLVLDAGLWWNPARSGTGLNIVQHASGQLFVVWFTYDAAGKPIWQVVSGGIWVDARTFEGSLYQARATVRSPGTFDPATVALRRVGSLRLEFADSEHATLTYSRLEGSSGSHAIERQRLPAREPAFLASLADMWWNPLESGAGLGVAHEGERLFLTWFAYDNAGEPTWLVASDVKRDPFIYAFRGDLYATHGPRDGEPFDPAKVVVRRVGSLAVAAPGPYSGDTSLRLDYQVDGVSHQRVLARQPF